MGLLDNILGAATGAARAQGPAGPDDSLASLMQGLAGGDPSRAAGVMGTMMELLQQSGGLGGVLSMFRASGLGEQADSWVSTGPNMALSGNQVEQTLGGPLVEQLASRMGLSSPQALAVLAQAIPAMVNSATPQGRVPDDGGNDAMASALSMLKGLTG